MTCQVMFPRSHAPRSSCYEVRFVTQLESNVIYFLFPVITHTLCIQHCNTTPTRAATATAHSLTCCCCHQHTTATTARCSPDAPTHSHYACTHTHMPLPPLAHTCTPLLPPLAHLHTTATLHSCCHQTLNPRMPLRCTKLHLTTALTSARRTLAMCLACARYPRLLRGRISDEAGTGT
jgi:hypothetical protein